MDCLSISGRFLSDLLVRQRVLLRRWILNPFFRSLYSVCCCVGDPQPVYSLSSVAGIRQRTNGLAPLRFQPGGNISPERLGLLVLLMIHLGNVGPQLRSLKESVEKEEEGVHQLTCLDENTPTVSGPPTPVLQRVHPRVKLVVRRQGKNIQRHTFCTHWGSFLVPRVALIDGAAQKVTCTIRTTSL